MFNVLERGKIDDPDSERSDTRSSINTSEDRDRRRILHESIEEEERWDIHVEDKRLPPKSRQGHPGPTSDVQADPHPLPMKMEQRLSSSHLLIRSHHDTHTPPSASDGGDDRAELLRQLDVLKDKLSRSGNLIDKGKAKVPQDMTRLAFSDEDRNRMLMQNPYPHQTPFQNQRAEPSPLMYRQDMRSHAFPPPHYDYAPNHVYRYGAPLRSHIHTRDPCQPLAYYQTSPPSAYRSRSNRDDMAFMDTVDPYPSTFNRHHPSCSCYQCLNKRQVPAPILPTAYADKYSDMLGYHDNPGSFGSREYYNNGFSDHLPLTSHNSQSHARWPSVDSEVFGYSNRSPPRVHMVSGGKRCSAVAGGAPFFICSNCSELLFLSIKVLTRNKIRCGACSIVIVVAISNKRLVVSTDLPAKDITPKEADNSPDLKLRNGTDHRNQASTTFPSDDYDNCGYDYHNMDGEIGQGSESASKSMERKTHHSASPHASKADEDRETLASATKHSNSKKSKGTSPHAASSLHHHFDYSNKFNAVNRSEDGNLDAHSRHEEVPLLPNKTAPPQISRKDSSATEIDLSSNEFNNTGTTLDSGEGSRGRDNLKASRAAKSFFAGIIEESFKDSERSSEYVEQEKANVTVNGHLIPDRLIKKAQKLAGPISPGNYWYDFRAGFWGAIGGPCLGIIPPFIEEFNYPMGKHCGGGNTNVFVNGRELNQKDLNLLIDRGLPKERDRSYIIEISGRVVDDQTGEELESLGKLAPTVERMKRGFGMRAPKPAP